ncbi:hypothetical protein [Actinomadura sp. HBU206391]|uniref:hypothetical protein n=1 Tax=Actinomadura sp. HBU206391 TaxID=2731692 RepID=UPI00164EF950|nr:hypothetical protein [Actinomadura sp. HBU206391]MBC6460566.1 hypothetical protein [Actinomadura sp. HBU206391]
MDPEHRPLTCPYHHPMKRGLIRVGWAPCDCPPALARHRGHRTYWCEKCSTVGVTTVSYNPEHLPADGTRGRHPLTVW